METNVNYTIVGIFVISLVACIVLAIIWLSAGLSLEQYTIYKVNMKESVSGLSPDSAVEYNGVNVGTVKHIDINQKNPQLVELLLSIKSKTPVTVGTTATLNVRGLTGITFVALTDKGSNRAPLLPKPGDDYAVINTVPSFFLQLDTALTKLNDNIHAVSSSLQSLLNKDNLNSVKQILINFRQFTDTLSTNRQQFGGILQSVSTQTLPATNDAIINIDAMTSALTGISKEIKQNPSILIRGRAEQALGPGE